MSRAGVTPPHIVIAGAGLIGCFCGGLWAAAGYPVTLLGRRRILAPIANVGLAVTDFAGLSKRVGAAQLRCSEDPGVLIDADVVIVAVKTSATAAMGQQIALHAPPNAPVISFQNGMGNASLLQQMLPGRDVRAAMVPFNVVTPDILPLSEGASLKQASLKQASPEETSPEETSPEETSPQEAAVSQSERQGTSFTPAGFHRASSGDIVIAQGPGHWGRRLSVPGLAVAESPDISAVQWGKLLINLNNALNALSGVPLMTQLQNRQWRRLMADQMAEALRVMQAAGLRPVSTTPLPVWMSPYILRLPTWAFSRIAAQMLTIDPSARSSMAQDLMQGRITEVDALQGEIQRLGLAHGVATPICDVVMQLIRQAEMKNAGLPKMQPGQI